MLFLTCACIFTQAQVRIITTIAGNGVKGYGGDGGPATNAEFKIIQTLCYSNGNVYTPDAFNNRIRKLNLATGIVTTIAGMDTFGYNGDNIPATNAWLNIPGGVCADSSGNIFIADEGNQRIRKIDVNTGLITTIAGNGIAGYSGDGGSATDAEMYVPFGISIDKYSNLYFADQGNNVIRKIDASGIITTIAGNGFAGFSGDGGPATDAELNWPNKAFIDTAGDIIIMDGFNYVIRKIDAATGVISTIAGTPGVAGFAGDGGPAASALFNGPSQGYVDKWNDIYFADDENGVIRKIDGAGIITTIAGIGDTGFSGDGGPATAAKLYPTDVCMDEFGTFFIADFGNNRIREVYNSKLAVNNQSVLNNEVRVFPNPAPSSIIVKYDFTNDGEVQVVNMMGQIMASVALSAAIREKELNISNLPQGLYQYRIFQNSELVCSGKMVKE